MIPFQFKELIETETNYVHALEMILTCESPLEDYLRENNQLIFGHIKEFLHIHSTFLNELRKCVNKGSNGSSTKISACFLNIKDKFLKYGEYYVALHKTQALLGDTLVQLAQGEWKLKDLLSLPMQRILKYHLLLEQLVKNSDDDYQGLKRAHELMMDLGLYINQVKIDLEALQIIVNIQESIAGLTNAQLPDYGRLITDGFIRIKVPSHEHKNKLPHDTTKPKRYVFVFDKVLLLCKMSGVRETKFKEALFLNEYTIEANPVTEKSNFTFNLIKISDRTIYSFYAKTLESKNRWIDAIQKAIDNIIPEVCKLNQTNHEYTMHTFEKATYCDHCSKLLLGLCYQGYKCSICFTSVHKKCLVTTRPCGPTLPPRPNNETDSNDLTYSEVDNNYYNSIPEDYSWFYGPMERDVAQRSLENETHGTFLVRISPKHKSYVISLNHSSQVKHMRIYVSQCGQYYLAQNRYFKSLVDLVLWYEKNSLVESFHMLDARLSIPFKPLIL